MFCFTEKVQPERTPLLTRAGAPEPEAAPRQRPLSAHWQRALAAARKRVSPPHGKKKPKEPRRAAAVPSSPGLLGRRLRAAVDARWPRRLHGRYRAVKVFLTYWNDADDDDDDAAGTAARAIADVLGRAYGFDVETWLIPGVLEPEDVLGAKLRDLVRAHGREGHLLIFWYGGRVMETEESPMWFGERVGAKINSDIVPMILGASDGDVLALYDCEASPRAETANGAGVFEMLAAGSTHGTVSGFASCYSFTRSLVRILEKPLHMACGIAVLDLHRKLVSQVRHGRAPDEADRGADAQNGAGGPSPNYCHVSRCGARSEGKPATIVLSRMDYPMEAFGYDSSGEELEVTVQLRLRKNDINVRRWTEWITSAPPEADQVHVTTSRGYTTE